ncbi:MAG: hypothetical protein KGZ66_05095 [Selenomonadales bacterium]|nr:hypothetical protein [Selenomonadales bacterium]
MSGYERRELAKRNLVSATSRVTKRTGHVANVAESLLAVTNKIALQATKQSAAVSSLKSKMDAYAGSAADVLVTSQDSVGLAKRAVDAAAQGKQSVQEFLAAMESIKSAVDAARAVVGVLNARTRDTDEMLNTIRDIAEATSILALNASIQSAHAGQAGRGFAVVAQEVKRLAERSTMSALAMQSSVDEVAQGIRKTVAALESILARVAEGEVLAASTEQSFAAIYVAANETSSAFREIGTALAQQAESLDNVTSSIASMNDSFERLYSLVEVSSSYASFAENTITALSRQAMDLSATGEALLAASEIVDARTHVVLNLPYAPQTYDPHKNFDFYGAQLLSNVHMGLLASDAKDAIIPGLASKWSYDEDALTWSFVVHPEARFSNGCRVTASDVKFSLERLADPKVESPSSWALTGIDGLAEFAAGTRAEITGIKVQDEHTVAIKLSEPFSGLLTNLSHYFAAVISAAEANEGRIVGAGAYYIAEHTDEFCRLLASPTHLKGEPAVNCIEFSFSNADIPAKLSAGKLDIAFIESAEVWAGVRALPRVEVLQRSILGYTYLGLNLRSPHPVLSDSEARRTLSLAINRSHLVEEVLAGMGAEAYAPLSPSVFGEGISGRFAPQEAERILSRFRASKPLTILLRSDEQAPLYERLGEFCIAALKAVGLETRVVRVPHSVYRNPENIAQADLYLSRWVADTPDADALLTPIFYSGVSTNMSGYSNPEVDMLIDRARKTLNGAKRLAYLKEAERIIVQDMPVVCLNYITLGVGFDQSLRHVAVSPMGLIRCEDIVKAGS